MLTQETLKESLHYDSQTGLFTWLRQQAPNVKIGIVAGTRHYGNGKNEYFEITVFNKRYLSHRLAWFYVYGKFPENYIDHINGNGLDNRIENLREATRFENQKNRYMNSNNTSGYKGVTKNKRDGTWTAQAWTNSKRFFLGNFEKIEDAAEAYKQFSIKVHGEFYREAK